MINLNKRQLGLNIKRERKRAGLTQEELATILDVSSNYISAIECGKKTPKLEMFFKMSDALNVGLDAFATDITSVGKKNSLIHLDIKISELDENEYHLITTTINNLLEYFATSKEHNN